MPGLESVAADLCEAIPGEISGERGGHTKQSGLPYRERGQRRSPLQEWCQSTVEEGGNCCFPSICSLPRGAREGHTC